MFICLFPGSRVTTDQRVVAKKEIQEVESAKRAGAPYAHMRTIVTRRETQTQSCGSNLRMRLERDDTETRGLRGLGEGECASSSFKES